MSQIRKVGSILNSVNKIIVGIWIRVGIPVSGVIVHLFGIAYEKDCSMDRILS